MTNLPTLGNFNVFVFGASGVGKTTFIRKHATGDFTHAHTPTATTQTTPLSFCFEGYDEEGDDLVGMVHLNVHDHVSGDTWDEADAAIFMFDCCQTTTIDNAIQTRQIFSSYHPSIPTVFLGNKNDLIPFSISSDPLFSFSSEPLFSISSKTNNNYEKPFLYVVRHLLNNSTLKFREMPVPEIPVVQIHPSLHALALQELEAASVIPLPDLPDIEENDLSDEPDLPSDYFIQGNVWDSPASSLSSSDDEF